MILNSPYISGSSTITGNLNVLGTITGSTNSAISASYANNATSASYALNATSASFALVATSASYSNNSTSASYSNNSTSASYALASTSASYALVTTSASYAANADLLDGRDSLTFANTGSNSFVGTQNINGSVAITGSLTTTGAITAQTLNVQQVTSSIVYSSGSNIFGNSISNTQSMTGSVGISGSLAVTGASTITGALTLNSTITNGTYTYTLPSATGTLALTSDLSGYLPLTGGTLTGALSGTSATFSGQIKTTFAGQSISINAASTDSVRIQLQNTSGNAGVVVENSVGGDQFTGTTAYSMVIGTFTAKDLFLGTNSAQRFKLDGTSGAATFINGAAKLFEIASNTATGGYTRFTYNTSTSIGYIGSSSQLSGSGIVSDLELRADNNLFLTTTGGSLKLASTGAATFSESVSFVSSSSIPTVGFANNADGLLLMAGASNGVRINNAANSLELFKITNAGVATFSSSVTTLSVFRITQASVNRGGLYTYNQWLGSGVDYSVGIGSEAGFFIGTGGTTTKRLTIASTGEATFSSSVTATSATFSGDVGITGTTAAILTLNGSAGSTAGMMINPSSSSRAGIVFYQQATVDKWQMGMSVGASPTFDLYTQGASANAISFAYATGAATFSSDVNSSSGFQGRYARVFEASAQRGGLYPYNLIVGSGTDYSLGIFSEEEIYMASGGTVTKRLVINAAGAVSIAGALSKGSGSFRIEHPLPSLSKTHQLVHSFIEGPQADLIYRGRLILVNGKAQANIDEVSTMTEGTFEVLCREVQCFTTNESGWDLIKGKVIGNIIYIESQNESSTDEISWMVIGERKDKHMMETEWTDEDGKVIVESLKPIEP